MSDIFEVKNQDRRQELIEAFGKEWSFKAQKPTGSDVEYFSPETGFVLLSKQSNLDLSKKFMQRVYACAKLSLGPTLELRERSIGKVSSPTLDLVSLLASASTNSIILCVKLLS